MLINVSVVLLILLSGYWFGFKEGFFSGVVHLVCVVVSGALTFAFWEPLSMTMLPTAMGEFAWGLSFLGLFCFSLIILRIATNLLIPSRLNFPPTVDYTCGSIVGLAIGIVTAGMGLIGAGFLPIGGTVAGEIGMLRTSEAQGQPESAGSITPPVHKWVEQLYATLSVGAFSPLVNSQSLKQDYPGLAEQSWSLQRDTASRGRIKLAIAPEDVEIDNIFIATMPGMGSQEFYVVPITFMKSSYHNGDYFVLSSAQARLVGDAPAGVKPNEVFPEAWKQGKKPIYRFDDVSHYVTNEPAEQTVKASLAFPASGLGGQTPKAIILRGTRFPLVISQGPAEVQNEMTLVDSSAPMVSPPFISIGTQLGVEFSKNMKPAEIILDPETRGVVSGFGEVPTTVRGIISKNLKVNELFEPEGTKIVRINLSRGSSQIDIWGDKSDARTKEGNDAELILIDDQGQTYIPRGFLHRRDLARQLVIELDPINGIRRVRDLPQLSTAGKDQLEVLFLVPEGRNIIGLKLGDTTVARFAFRAKRGR